MTPRDPAGSAELTKSPILKKLVGARDLNRGLTVPNRLAGVSSSVLAAPQVSSRTQNAVASCPFVSARFLSVPRMRDTAVTRREVKGSR